MITILPQANTCFFMFAFASFWGSTCTNFTSWLKFRTLRKLFNVDPADYMISICGDDALRELSSPGKSGSFFYLTDDDRYMIKTMKKAEVKVRWPPSPYNPFPMYILWLVLSNCLVSILVGRLSRIPSSQTKCVILIFQVMVMIVQVLLRMLSAYYNHFRAFENTLVTKFYGLHCVKLNGPNQKKVFMSQQSEIHWSVICHGIALILISEPFQCYKLAYFSWQF